MFDDLATLFYDSVLSAYEDYTAAREDNTSGRSLHLRTGIEAATALFHFREHLPAQHKKNRGQVAAECPDYRMVADVVNAVKHRVVTKNTPEGAPLVTSAEDLEEATIITIYADVDGEYSDSRTAIFANCSDKVRRNLDVTLTNVINYWGKELENINIIRFSPQPMPVLPGTRFVARPNARSTNFEIVRGIRWRQTIQLLRFNVAKGFAEPVKLTGSELKMRLYRATYAIEINVPHPNGGESISCVLELSEDQSLALHKLKTEVEREQFVRLLTYDKQKEINQMIAEALKARDVANAKKV